ncbi:amylo-alpha-1,6-glucosidase [Plantibacter sp. M259]|uniref:amylo-alpha-1,6-glucosidase n=1 Tax=Plantibacter sp. M259 TaxID=2583822 RepID=UPI001110115C|nr:glycogen debranching protein [Plantibacter sp. M259]
MSITTAATASAATLSPSSTPFDVREIPFSARGSWMNLSPVVALHTTAPDIHLVSHQTGMHAVLSIVPERAGVPVETEVSATPARLRWTTGPVGDDSIEAAFAGLDTVRLRGTGLGVRLGDAAAGLTPFTGTYLFVDPMDRSAIFTSYETGRRYRVTSLSGDVAVIGAELLGAGERAVVLGADGEPWEVAIEEFETARPPYASVVAFDGIAADTAARFDEYVDAVAPWRSARTPAAALAAYVLWSATVSPRGFLGRESVLMSKHWMDKVWSWDHSFNALALAPGLPGAAMDQFVGVFDHRDESGAAPDSTTHSEILYNFVKPPIHGWAFAKLRNRIETPLDGATLHQVADILARWSRFWLHARTAPGRRLPHYQHGNDSGWDNSTTFDADRVIESPELAAFLVVQLDVLAGLSDELETGEGDRWRTAAEEIRTALLEDLWDGRNFIAVAPLTGRSSSTTSLLNLLVIAAGDRLPRDIATRVAASIEEHLTEFGPATELTTSPEYESDGYWRGPIWAPSTVLVEDGLRRAGFANLADTISERFRGLCERSGFAENFDALTGEGLRDRAYTWTASSYLLLAGEAETRRREASID